MANTINQAKPRIVFRADGNSRIGLGHVVRSLALAQMLHEDFSCVFAIQQPEQALQAQLLGVCEEVVVLAEQEVTEQEAACLARQVLRPTDVVVLDGYRFDTAYQQRVKESGCSLVCIDDIHAYPFVADAVINQAGGVSEAAYTTAPYTKLLLGPEYALLRPPFLKASQQERTVPVGALRVLLNMGGADPQNVTLQLAGELAEDSRVNSMEIVVGGAYQHLQELQSWLQGREQVRLHRNLDAEAMCLLMEGCAVAVTSASGVAYEYAAVGGGLFVLQTAGNQTGLYSFLTHTGIAKPYEELQQLGPSDFKSGFQKQVQVQRQYFDGQSPQRLQQQFRNFSLSAALTFRRASEEDLMLIYSWNNDPEVRRYSFNPEPIPLPNHQAWFSARLSDAATPIYVVEAAGEPAAQVRFSLQGKAATVGYLIDSKFRGKGLGHVVLQRGVARLQQDFPDIMLVEGLVQRQNIPSVRAFEKAGFAYGEPDPQHPKARRFVLELPKKD